MTATMPALTLWQPWASLMAIGVKSIETRSWPAPVKLIGDRIALHAAARVPTPARGPMFVGDFHVAQGGTWLHGRDVDVPMPFGAVVATARLSACVPIVETESHRPAPQRSDQPCVTNPHDGGNLVGYWRDGFVTYFSDRPFGDYRVGRWAWLLEDVEPLAEPVPARGRQRVWRWTP